MKSISRTVPAFGDHVCFYATFSSEKLSMKYFVVRLQIEAYELHDYKSFAHMYN